MSSRALSVFKSLMTGKSDSATRAKPPLGDFGSRSEGSAWRRKASTATTTNAADASRPAVSRLRTGLRAAKRQGDGKHADRQGAGEADQQAQPRVGEVRAQKGAQTGAGPQGRQDLQQPHGVKQGQAGAKEGPADGQQRPLRQEQVAHG